MRVRLQQGLLLVVCSRAALRSSPVWEMVCSFIVGIVFGVGVDIYVVVSMIFVVVVCCKLHAHFPEKTNSYSRLFYEKPFYKKLLLDMPKF